MSKAKGFARPSKFAVRINPPTMISTIGKENFFNLAKELDSNAMKNISPNDIQRLRRRWEVNFFTKKKIREWKQNETKILLNKKDNKIVLYHLEKSENDKR